MKNRLLVLLALMACLVATDVPTTGATLDDDPNVLGVVVVTE